MTLELSVVIPAYDEALRLPPYLTSIRDYLDVALPDAYEITVVDDGSRDGTAEVVRKLSLDWPALHLLRHQANRGKGAAVRTGVLASRGRHVLFADADGATAIEQEINLRGAIASGADLAVGSRYLNDALIVHRQWNRRLMGLAFSTLVRRLLSISVLDSQCGFKMMRSGAGRLLFENCSEDGYLFDLHIIALAGRLGLRIDEVGVSWAEMPGTKVRLIRDSWQMFVGLLRLRRRVIDATEVIKTRA
jgi:dolichyl-phosphate beta-glucosyltransferase